MLNKHWRRWVMNHGDIYLARRTRVTSYGIVYSNSTFVFVCTYLWRPSLRVDVCDTNKSTVSISQSEFIWFNSILKSGPILTRYLQIFASSDSFVDLWRFLKREVPEQPVEMADKSENQSKNFTFWNCAHSTGFHQIRKNTPTWKYDFLGVLKRAVPEQPVEVGNKYSSAC